MPEEDSLNWIFFSVKDNIVVCPNERLDNEFNQFGSFNIRLSRNSMPLNINAAYHSSEANKLELLKLIDNVKSNTVLYGDFNYQKIYWENQISDNPSRPFLDKVN